MTAQPSIRILIGTASALKVKSAELAFAEAFPGRVIQVTTAKAASKINEQPIGWKETSLGAYNRLEHAKELKKAEVSAGTFDFAVSIENGIVEIDTSLPTDATGSGSSVSYLDVAFVVVERLKNVTDGKKLVFATSTGLPVAKKFIDETQAIGFDKVHVGSTLTKHYADRAINPNDPHLTITGNLLSRVAMMHQALICAYGQFLFP